MHHYEEWFQGNYQRSYCGQAIDKPQQCDHGETCLHQNIWQPYQGLENHWDCHKCTHTDFCTNGWVWTENFYWPFYISIAWLLPFISKKCNFFLSNYPPCKPPFGFGFVYFRLKDREIQQYCPFFGCLACSEKFDQETSCSKSEINTHNFIITMSLLIVLIHCGNGIDSWHFLLSFLFIFFRLGL